MSEECLGCEWYNKLYWSIISPCTNCPKRFKNNTIKVTKYSINIDKTDLYKRIEELQQRIDKAIEYIGYSKEISNPQDYIKFERKLLEILRGKDEYKLPFDEEVQSGLDSLSIRGKDER